MKILLAQTKLKIADFNYNFKSIKDKINDDCDHSNKKRRG